MSTDARVFDRRLCLGDGGMMSSRPHAAAPPTQDHRDPGRGRAFGFAAATASFVTVFIAGATPFPLYLVYRISDRITDVEFSIATVVYFVCAVTSLLVLGRLSNHLGRKPVTLVGLGLAALGCAVLTAVHGPEMLVLGRALQGLAAGLAASAMGAYALDLAPSRPRWLAPVVSASATNVGLSIGAFGAGALVELAPGPRVLTYAVAIGLILSCAALVVAAPEPIRANRGAIASLRPRFTLPRAVLPESPAAVSVFVATWALGGYFQSFGAAITAGDLHSTSALLAAAVVTSYMAPTVLAGPVAGRMTPRAAQRAGLTAVLVAAATLVAAVAVTSPGLVIGAGVVGGLGMGFAMTGSMRALLSRTGAAERAGLLALVYAVSYTGAAVPSLIAGQLSRSVDLLLITSGYAALTAVAWVVVLLAPRRST